MENNENADNGGVDRSVAELRNWKAAGSIPRRESTFCSNSYFSNRFTPVLPQWHMKDPGHSAKCAGGRLRSNMQTTYVALNDKPL